jgi:hypothetical protein
MKGPASAISELQAGIEFQMAESFARAASFRDGPLGQTRNPGTQTKPLISQALFLDSELAGSARARE